MVSQSNIQEYILVVSCQFRQRVYTSDFFDEAESTWVISKVIKKLFTQNQAKFENYLMNDDFDILQRDEFFKS